MEKLFNGSHSKNQRKACLGLYKFIGMLFSKDGPLQSKKFNYYPIGPVLSLCFAFATIIAITATIPIAIRIIERIISLNLVY